VGRVGIEDTVLIPVQLSELPETKHEEVPGFGAVVESEANASRVRGGAFKHLLGVVVR
jgi:hypothetical protein